MDLTRHVAHPFVKLHLAVRYDPCTGMVWLSDSFEESPGQRSLEVTEFLSADRPEALNIALRRKVAELVRIEEKRHRLRQTR